MQFSSSFSLLIAVAASCSLGLGSDAQTLEPIQTYKARLQERFESTFESQSEADGVWLGIYDPDYGDLYFALGNSTASIPETTPADVATAEDQFFHIGSISKTFMGTIVMILANRGDLALEDTVQDLVPDFALQFPQYANYTLSNLLRMETIVPDFLNDQNPNGLINDYSQNITNRYTIEEVVTYAMELYPKTNPDYSTTNILVAEYIVSNITGMPIQDVLQELIFDPLGLTNTSLPDRFGDGILPDPSATPYAGPECYNELIDSSAVGIERNQDLTEFSHGIVFASSGGSMSSNIYDLLAWAKTGTGDSLLTEEMVNLRHRYSSLGAQASYSYGITQYVYNVTTLGPFSRFLSGWYGHSGDAFGFGTAAYRSDEYNGASFAGAMNSCSIGDEVLLPMLQVFVEELDFRKETNAPTPIMNPSTPSPSPTKTPMEATESPTMATTSSAPNSMDVPRVFQKLVTVSILSALFLFG